MSTEIHPDRYPTHLFPQVADRRAGRFRALLFHGLVASTVVAFAVFAGQTAEPPKVEGHALGSADASVETGLAPCPAPATDPPAHPAP